METLPGLPPLSTARYGRGFQYGFSREGYGDIASCPAIAVPGGGNPAGCVNKGFVTSAAFGYRLNATLAYELGALHLTPALGWAHDVAEYSPTGQLIKDRKIVRPSLSWEYGKTMFGGLSYSHDLKSSTYNNADDHDYVQTWIGLHF